MKPGSPRKRGPRTPRLPKLIDSEPIDPWLLFVLVIIGVFIAVGIVLVWPQPFL